jgi:HPt (histidine-containing phosphotransfer) domain-containing protein
MDALVTKPFDRAELEAALAGTRPETIAPRPSEELDAWRLDELRAMDGGDAAFVEEMFATLLSDTGHSVEALRAADPAAAGDIGHRLKSSAAMLGARRLAEVFAAIEAATRSDEVDAAALGELIERIPREIRRARRAFAAYLVGLSKGPGPGQTGSHRTGDRTVAET